MMMKNVDFLCLRVATKPPNHELFGRLPNQRRYPSLLRGSPYGSNNTGWHIQIFLEGALDGLFENSTRFQHTVLLLAVVI
jgi:hypothetical protein